MEKGFAATNNRTVFSEDFPMGLKECGIVRNIAGHLTAAFGYLQTGGTQFTSSKIDQNAQNCKSEVIILTRAYWPNSEWRTKTDAVLHQPKLFGVAMLFNPDDSGKRNQIRYITNVLAVGKVAMFLLPFRVKPGDPTQRQITQFIQYLEANRVI